MSEEIEKKLELIPKIWKLLKNWSTYYVLLIFGLGYWIYNDENRISDLYSKIDKNEIDYRIALESLQKKLEDRNCIEVFKAWKEAVQPKYDQEEKDAKIDLENERKRTEQLNETYKLLNQSK